MMKFEPFTSSFMLTSIVGFMVSVLFIIKIDLTWGFTFALFFVIMFIASIVSMSNIEEGDREAMSHLAIHDKKKKKQNN